MEPLLLHYLIDNQLLILITDASNIGSGGVLQQEINRELHNLHYHSQLMTPCERKYGAFRKEALAIYKRFTRMQAFLLGCSIIIMIDHCPLSYYAPDGKRCSCQSNNSSNSRIQC